MLFKNRTQTHTYTDLGKAFYERSAPARFPKPELLLWNSELSNSLGLDELSTQQKAQLGVGDLREESDLPSLIYAGHQFGHFNPQLGDGRAHLLAELSDKHGDKTDLHLKGSGITAFSRRGDGRCALGPALREYIMSEAMYALGVPSCRTLAVVGTGETVYRERELPGAVVTRVASSHIRIGTFQYFAAQQKLDELRLLTEHCIQRHYPDIAAAQQARELSSSEAYAALLSSFIDKQVHLVSEWMRVGFIHGVMNTDNMTLSGETIDYGPCAMMEAYDPDAVFSSIDHQGRYAFSSQPDIALWNTTRFAETLIPLMGEDTDIAVETLSTILKEFQQKFEHAYISMLHKKFGVPSASNDSREAILKTLKKMHALKMDFTNTFYELSKTGDIQEKALNNEFKQHLESIKPSIGFIQDKTTMKKVNPVIIPRNHIVEQHLLTAVESGQIGDIENFIRALQQPYKESSVNESYRETDPNQNAGYQTFCGT